MNAGLEKISNHGDAVESERVRERFLACLVLTIWSVDQTENADIGVSKFDVIDAFAVFAKTTRARLIPVNVEQMLGDEMKRYVFGGLAAGAAVGAVDYPPRTLVNVCHFLIF